MTTTPGGAVASTALTELSERQRERALDRYKSFDRTWERRAAGGRRRGSAAIANRAALGEPISAVRTGRPDPRRPADQGKRRRVPDELRRLAEGLALQRPPFGPSAIYREVCRIARARGEQPPGYHTIYNVIRAIPDDLKTLALNGEKAYREAYDLVHRREAERPNQIWQADHTQLDLWAKRADGEQARPWLTVIIDDYSRAIAGFFISFDSPSAARTALTLRQAIWRKADAHWIVFGIPEIFYTDNGSDFTSGHLEQVAADIKMRLIFSAPGQPRGRGRIERFFETVNQMFLCTLPGYIDRGAVRGRTGIDRRRTLDRGFRDFCASTTRGPTAKPRFRRRSAGSRAVCSPHGGILGAARPAASDGRQERKIQPDGVRFQGMRYIDPTLAAYVGESVVLRYDPRDMAEVRLFHRGTSFSAARSARNSPDRPLRCAIFVWPGINGAVISARRCVSGGKPLSSWLTCVGGHHRQRHQNSNTEPEPAT